MKTTPRQGPYVIGVFHYPKDGTTGVCEIGPVDENVVLATVYLPTDKYKNHGEGEANARMFAYSYELLEEITLLLECGLDSKVNPKYQPYFDAVKDVIKKIKESDATTPMNGQSEE